MTFRGFASPYLSRKLIFSFKIYKMAKKKKVYKKQRINAVHPKTKKGKVGILNLRTNMVRFSIFERRYHIAELSLLGTINYFEKC